MLHDLILTLTRNTQLTKQGISAAIGKMSAAEKQNQIKKVGRDHQFGRAQSACQRRRTVEVDLLLTLNPRPTASSSSTSRTRRARRSSTSSTSRRTALSARVLASSLVSTNGRTARITAERSVAEPPKLTLQTSPSTSRTTLSSASPTARSTPRRRS